MAKAPDFNEIMRPLRLMAIASEAVQEVTRAREKHGPNTGLAYGNDPNGSLIEELVFEGDLANDASEIGNNLALERAMQKINDDRCADGRKHTRLGILLEEAFEALSAATPAELRTELVQVVAMALDALADLDTEEA